MNKNNPNHFIGIFNLYILTIDDDYVNNIIIRENIKTIDDRIEVIEKSSLIDAICFLRNCRDKKSIPAIILCDYNLPPYTGQDFARIYKRFFFKKNDPTKIFLISATIDQNLTAEIEKYKFISAVFNKSEFDEMLEEIISTA